MKRVDVGFETKITTGGRVTVPAEIRRMLGLSPGDRLMFEVDNGSVVLTREEPEPAARS